jgi:hypothetical protein
LLDEDEVQVARKNPGVSAGDHNEKDQGAAATDPQLHDEKDFSMQNLVGYTKV